MTQPTAKPRRVPSPFMRVFASTFSRIYATVLMVVLGWAGYQAAGYLFNFVFRPVKTPGRVLQWQARTDLGAMRDTQDDSDQSRAPLPHFHRINRIIRPDPLNTCITSGCHDPLPHGAKTVVPTFANFHASFLSCQSCHAQLNERPIKFVWVDAVTGEVVNTPAVLRLIELLDREGERIRTKPASVQADILPLLREVVAARMQDRTIEDLRVRIENSDPGSPIWRAAMKRLIADLPRNGQGNYGARLTPTNLYPTLAGENSEMLKKVPDFLAAGEKPAERRVLHEEIHRSIPREALSCMACHGDAPKAMDFAAAGYTPARSDELSKLNLARTLEKVRKGGEFRLPALTEEPDGR